VIAHHPSFPSRFALGLLAGGLLLSGSAAADETCPSVAKTAVKKAPVAATSNRANGATTTVYDFKTLKIHAYTAPKQALRTSSYVIEGPHKLVVIEPQFMNSLSKDFRAYVDSLGKPIDRVLVTDRDPDHYFGLATGFTDVPAYALPSVISVIDKEGPALLEERRKVFGEEMPKQQLVPGHALNTGKETIDCVHYQFDASTDDEGGQQATIRLPDYGVIATGDIASNRCHIVPGKATEQRLKAYAKNAKAYSLVLPANGLPSDSQLFKTNLAYLKKVKANLKVAKTAEAYQKLMTTAYPDYDCEIYFMFYVPAHYQPKKN
jgi:hypothetical protein